MITLCIRCDLYYHNLSSDFPHLKRKIYNRMKYINYSCLKSNFDKLATDSIKILLYYFSNDKKGNRYQSKCRCYK